MDKTDNRKMSYKEVYDNLVKLSFLLINTSASLDYRSDVDKKDIYKLGVMYSDLRDIEMKYFRKYKKM